MTLEGINWIAVTLATALNIVFFYIWNSRVIGHYVEVAPLITDEPFPKSMSKLLLIGIYAFAAAMILAKLDYLLDVIGEVNAFWIWAPFTALPFFISGSILGRDRGITALEAVQYYVGHAISFLVIVFS